jgi:hypothetical protein
METIVEKSLVPLTAALAAKREFVENGGVSGRRRRSRAGGYVRVFECLNIVC